jgi:hypothetical protein
MARDGFTLVTDWLVEGTIEEVATILSEPERFPEWWSEVYLSVQEVAPGDPDGVGRTVAVRTRGWLPYTLRWQGRLVESQRPHGWAVEASGDLTGRGLWRLEQRGNLAAVHYDWRVDVDKPMLRALAPLLRHAYSANHRWAMARGLEGLRSEILRRRAVARIRPGSPPADR